MTQITSCTKCGSDCETESGVCCSCRVRGEKKLFIDYYRQLGSVGQAAKLSKVSRSTVYLWMDSDPEFKAMYEEELKPNRTDEILSSLYQVALGEKNYTQAQVTAAIFLLKAFDPKVFAEKQQASGGFSGELVKIQFVVENLRDGDLEPVVVSRPAVAEGEGHQNLRIKSPC